MGYTNYWHQHDNFSDTKWQLIKKEYEYIKEVMSGIIVDQSQGDDEICFNGKYLEHETFILNKKVDRIKKYPEHDVSFNFCKTALKPYDLAVWYLLNFINRICPEISIKRDQ